MIEQTCMSNDTPPRLRDDAPRSGSHAVGAVDDPVRDHTAPRLRPKNEQASIGEVVEFVKSYAKQETVGPLRGAGRWVAFGAAGAICLGIGLSLLLLGLLRLLQTEVSDIADGRLSWLPYLIVLVVCVLLIVLAMAQVNKTFLDKEDKR